VVVRCEPSGTVPSRELVTRPLGVRIDVATERSAPALAPTDAATGDETAAADAATGKGEAAMPHTSQ